MMHQKLHSVLCLAIVFSLCCVMSQAARGQPQPSGADAVVGLTVWIPTHSEGGLRLILPRWKIQSPEHFARAYLHDLRQSAVYQPLLAMQDVDWTDFDPKQFFEFRISLSNPPQIAIIANRIGHMNSRDAILRSLWNAFQRHGSENYIVPLGLETVLAEAELMHFHQLIAHQFSALVAVGGGDIDPALYGEPVHGALALVPSRDRIEFQLIQTYLQAERGSFYGICRGHQMAAAVLGFKLYQDIPTEQPTQWKHAVSSLESATESGVASVWHPIQFVDRENPLARATHLYQMRVNSRHHQAVIAPARGETAGARVIALEEGKIVEALELKNHRGLTVQFHPEDMQTWESEAILAWMVEHLQH